MLTPVQETISGVNEAVLEIPAQSQIAALHKLDPASVSVIKRSDTGKATAHFFPLDEPVIAFEIVQGRVMQMQLQMPDWIFPS